jgi:putative endonuclease
MRDGHFCTFWVYIMDSRTGTLYTGMTGHLESRIQEHKTGTLEGFSKKYGCNRLVYYESYDDVGKALGREKQLKGWRRERKIALIEKMNPRWEDLAESVGREMVFPGQSIKRSLKRHGRGHTIGILRLRPRSFLTRPALRMTAAKGMGVFKGLAATALSFSAAVSSSFRCSAFASHAPVQRKAQ